MRLVRWCLASTSMQAVPCSENGVPCSVSAGELICLSTCLASPRYLFSLVSGNMIFPSSLSVKKISTCPAQKCSLNYPQKHPACGLFTFFCALSLRLTVRAFLLLIFPHALVIWFLLDLFSCSPVLLAYSCGPAHPLVDHLTCQQVIFFFIFCSHPFLLFLSAFFFFFLSSERSYS